MKRKEMETRLLDIASKGRQYAELQMTRDGRREKIVSVCEDLQTLVRERLASLEEDADELKKTVKELTRKVRKMHKKDNLIIIINIFIRSRSCTSC